MIIITGDVEFLPEHREEGIRLCNEHSVRSRKEPGCISHDCSVDIENGNLVRFIEHWESMEAVQQHFTIPEALAMVEKFQAMKAAPFVIRLFNSEELDSVEA